MTLGPKHVTWNYHLYVEVENKRVFLDIGFTATLCHLIMKKEECKIASREIVWPEQPCTVTFATE